MIAFKLPMPPSVNHMYVGMGRHKSRYYKDWLKECHATMSSAAWQHNPPARSARWELTLTCVMPNWRRRDIDNVLKPLIDFLADRLGLEDNHLVALAVVKAVVKGESYIAGEVKIG